MRKQAIQTMCKRVKIYTKETEEGFELQHGDAGNFVRLPYSSRDRYVQKLLVLAGLQEPWHVDTNKTETNHLELPKDHHDRIKKYIVPHLGEKPDWIKIYKMLRDPDVMYPGESYQPTGIVHSFHWIPWIAGKSSQIPEEVVPFHTRLHGYFPKRGRHPAYVTKKIMEILGADTTWIPCQAYGVTCRDIDYLFDHAFNDIDPVTNQFMYNPVPKRTNRKYKKKPTKIEEWKFVEANDLGSYPEDAAEYFVSQAKRWKKEKEKMADEAIERILKHSPELAQYL